MVKKCKRAVDLYLKRRNKERQISKRSIRERMCWNKPILSENIKCGVSLDLPVSNCHPTKICRQICYACQGRQYYRAAVTKSLAVNKLIRDDPERAAMHIACEAAGRPVRLAGSGELLPENRTLVDHLTCDWWGFTKRIDTYKAMPKLMFSLDGSTPDSTLDYIEESVPVDRRCYVRRPQDNPSPLEVAVTFPSHGARTNYVNEVLEDATDCPAIRKKIKGCWECKKCYSK